MSDELDHSVAILVNASAREFAAQLKEHLDRGLELQSSGRDGHMFWAILVGGPHANTTPPK